MKKVMLFLLVMLSLIFQAAQAEDVTKILQNGLEGYDGCEDAYIADWMDQNTGNDDTLYAEFEQCSG